MAYIKVFYCNFYSRNRSIYFKDFIFDKIIFGPKDINFPTYKILCTISNFIGLDDSFA